MTLYSYRCKHCGAVVDRFFPMGQQPTMVVCDSCGESMKRCFQTEGKISTYHPSRDLYAEKLKIGARKNTNAKKRGDA